MNSDFVSPPISNLNVDNFKSIKHLDLEPKQFNLFIGEPNSGKSNILEVLGLLSGLGFSQSDIKSFVRFDSFSNLFYDDLIEFNIKLKCNNLSLKISHKYDSFELILGNNTWRFDYDGIYQGGSSSGDIHTIEAQLKRIRMYRYRNFNDFPLRTSEYLLPPHGKNLFSIIFSSKGNRERLIDFMKAFSLAPVFKPQNKIIEFQKQQDGVIINYPYHIVSNTVKTMIFYLFALESNKNATMVFEEPESHTFPYYTKHLGELIATNKTNQFFIATHNTYFLTSILEKAPEDQVNVYVTYMDDFETKVKLLTSGQKEELLDFDPFANLQSFI